MGSSWTHAAHNSAQLIPVQGSGVPFLSGREAEMWGFEIGAECGGALRRTVCKVRESGGILRVDGLVFQS